MSIEQKYPDEPNFGLIVGLFCGTLVAIFLLTLVFLHVEGKHLTFQHARKNPNAELVWPGITRSTAG